MSSTKPISPLILAAMILASCAQNPQPFGAVPTEAQIQWQKMEMNMFCHFGPNTFTSLEWGEGNESEDLFCPSELDCEQWARTAREAGFGGIIITAKHHDGFCLWPNPESSHTVAQSSWREGRGDVLAELSQACAGENLAFGVYVSPWDRNDPRYGTEDYNGAFVRTLESIHDGRYGRIFEQWFDGACGEGPSGKVQVYDWLLFNGTVYKHSPNAVIFSDCGPGCRWTGNERGCAGRTNWSTLSTQGLAPGHVDDLRKLNEGMCGGESWIPSETDVSIRPGWFWKESETPSVKSLQQLLKIWYESAGRNSLLLLNVPPDVRGRIDPVDSLRLMELRAALDRIQSVNLAYGAKVAVSSRCSRKFAGKRLLDGDFDSYWAPREGDGHPYIELTLPEARKFNRLMIQEHIPLGQRVSAFSVSIPSESGEEGEWTSIAEETTIGYKRIVLFPSVETDRIRISIDSALASPLISEIALYMDEVSEF